MQNKLGNDFRIIEEGLNGRTAVFCDALTPFKQFGVGYDALPMILDSHRPIDLVILGLGANDLQFHRNNSIGTAVRGCGNCVKQIMMSAAGPEGNAPKVLLLSPPKFQKPAAYMELTFDEKILESEQVSYFYTMLAETYGVDLMDVSMSIEATPIDGVHLDEQGNQKLAECLSRKVLEIFKA